MYLTFVKTCDIIVSIKQSEEDNPVRRKIIKSVKCEQLIRPTPERSLFCCKQFYWFLQLSAV